MPFKSQKYQAGPVGWKFVKEQNLLTRNKVGLALVWLGWRKQNTDNWMAFMQCTRNFRYELLQDDASCLTTLQMTRMLLNSKTHSSSQPSRVLLWLISTSHFPAPRCHMAATFCKCNSSHWCLKVKLARMKERVASGSVEVRKNGFLR